MRRGQFQRAVRASRCRPLAPGPEPAAEGRRKGLVQRGGRHEKGGRRREARGQGAGSRQIAQSIVASHCLWLDAGARGRTEKFAQPSLFGVEASGMSSLFRFIQIPNKA